MTVVLEPLAEEGVLRPHATGDKWTIAGRLKFSGNYTAGGETGLLGEIEAILRQLGVNAIDYVDVSGNTEGYVLNWNYSNGKLQIYQTGAALKGKLEELPAGALPAGVTGAAVRLFCIGS